MKFSVITPTFRRRGKLERAVASLLAQTYKDWEMIIINDSPFDEDYREFASSINDPRIHYHINQKNSGVNFSRNQGLEKLSADSKWIIFLDDDDYFAPDCLQNFWNIIHKNIDVQWFLTNRAHKNGIPFTKVSRGENFYSYVKDYLLLKRIKGDATHCIETKLIIFKKIKFLQSVKQGEEWFFFYQVGMYSKIFYQDHNSTISDGYDEKQGLNFRKRTVTERLETLLKVMHEGYRKKLIHKPLFLLYLLMRLSLVFLKRKN